MEEDIKVLEELKETYITSGLYQIGTFELSEREKQAIENLIKRNKYLEERSNKINEQNIKYQNTLEKLQKETIWKSKVEEEFEKITEHKNCFNLGDMQLLLDNILGDD